MRNTVLGLMFCLAVTAACSCDSYDPDPYDNIPPVVTVEFNYLIPHQVSILRPAVQVNQLHFSKSEKSLNMIAPAIVMSWEPLSPPALAENSPPLIAPLRC